MGNAPRVGLRTTAPVVLQHSPSGTGYLAPGFTPQGSWFGQRCSGRQRTPGSWVASAQCSRRRRYRFAAAAAEHARLPAEQRVALRLQLGSFSDTGTLKHPVQSSGPPVAMQNHSAASRLLDGKAIANQVKNEIGGRVRELSNQYGRVPGLAVIIVGSRTDSQTYVRNKRKACEEVGIHSLLFALEESVSEEELTSLVRRLNADDSIDGILIQLPLPEHIKSERVLQEISLEKDVDGFHPLNIGRLCLKSPLYPPLAIACTPRGCLELLDRASVKIEGKHAVVLGRSNVVGLPMALLLLQRNATVTVCHSRTADIPEQVGRADIVVAAIGRANFVKGSWIKPGAVVIDVGINSVPDESAPRGYRLVGDVEFDTAKERAALITPVPGGVGPMTIAMLLLNTLQAFERRFKS